MVLCITKTRTRREILEREKAAEIHAKRTAASQRRLVSRVPPPLLEYSVFSGQNAAFYRESFFKEGGKYMFS